MPSSYRTLSSGLSLWASQILSKCRPRNPLFLSRAIPDTGRPYFKDDWPWTFHRESRDMPHHDKKKSSGPRSLSMISAALIFLNHLCLGFCWKASPMGIVASSLPLRTVAFVKIIRRSEETPRLPKGPPKVNLSRLSRLSPLVAAPFQSKFLGATSSAFTTMFSIHLQVGPLGCI